MSNTVKSFDILAIDLRILHNYFDSLIKLFSDLYLAKFLNISANRSFRAIEIANNFNPCANICKKNKFSNLKFHQIFVQFCNVIN